jgi:hypothetical protein
MGKLQGSCPGPAGWIRVMDGKKGLQKKSFQKGGCSKTSILGSFSDKSISNIPYIIQKNK